MAWKGSGQGRDLEGQSRGDEEPGTGVRASPGLGLQRVSGRRARDPPRESREQGGTGRGDPEGHRGMPSQWSWHQGISRDLGTILGPYLGGGGGAAGGGSCLIAQESTKSCTALDLRCTALGCTARPSPATVRSIHPIQKPKSAENTANGMPTVHGFSLLGGESCSTVGAHSTSLCEQLGSCTKCKRRD